MGLAGLLLLLQAALWPVASVKVEGVQRLSAAHVAAASGVKQGDTAGSATLGEACERVMKTGLFRFCNYKYSPTSANAIDVVLSVAELPAPQRVRFTIPGVDEKELWDWLKKNEPLVRDTMPSNDDAIAFYTAAVRRFLKSDVTANVESDLKTHTQTFIFRPKNLPLIQDVSFTGASSIPIERLRDALLPVAKGTPSTEFDVRRLLDLNVKPLFEEQGRLAVEFPSVRGDSNVVIEVREGPVHTLRTVKISGNLQPRGFPIGETANWKKIDAAADGLKQDLRNRGHLEASHALRRELHDGQADVTVELRPGPVFTFGKLVFEGLEPVLEKRLRSSWRLREGEPMNEGYVNEFLKSVKEDMPRRVTSLSVDMPARAGNVVDVRIRFGNAQ
jgi:outer membrane protein assembly factor BamA